MTCAPGREGTRPPDTAVRPSEPALPVVRRRGPRRTATYAPVATGRAASPGTVSMPPRARARGYRAMRQARSIIWTRVLPTWSVSFARTFLPGRQHDARLRLAGVLDGTRFGRVLQRETGAADGLGGRHLSRCPMSSEIPVLRRRTASCAHSPGTNMRHCSGQDAASETACTLTATWQLARLPRAGTSISAR